MKFAYSSMKIFARRAEIEFRGLVAEEFAMHARPDEAAIGVDVHLGHAEFGRGQIFVFIHAARARIELAAGGIDALHFFHRHARAAVHDDRHPRNLLLRSLR